jgi:hypothetical protein
VIRRAQIVSTVLELFGMAAVVAGTAVIFWPAALIVGGLSLLLIGYAAGVDSEAS